MKRIVKLITGAVLAMCGGAWGGVVSGASQEVEMTILPSGADVTKSVLVQCPLLGAESVSATIDGTILLADERFSVGVKCRNQPVAEGKRVVIFFYLFCLHLKIRISTIRLVSDKWVCRKPRSIFDTGGRTHASAALWHIGICKQGTPCFLSRRIWMCLTKRCGVKERWNE